MGAMAHGRFNFRDGAASRVARVVGAANECLHLTPTCATTVRTDSILFVLPPSFGMRFPPRWVILEGLRPPERFAASRDATNHVKKIDSEHIAAIHHPHAKTKPF